MIIPLGFRGEILMKKAFMISIVIISMCLIVSISYFYIMHENEEEDNNRNQPLFTYYSDDPIVDSEYNSKELDDVKPIGINIYSYDEEEIFSDIEIKEIGALLSLEMSNRMGENVTQDGISCFRFSEGEFEFTRYLEINRMGNIDFKDRKIVGFTDNMTPEELINISYSIAEKVSAEEDLNITLIKKEKVMKYPFTDDQFDIGSFYWIYMNQEIDKIKVRKAHVSVYVRNGEIVGYSDSRFYFNKMRMVEHLANMYTSREASVFALEYISEEHGFDIEELEVDDWDLQYGYDRDMNLITPIYTFQIRKDHRPYFVMMHGDKDHHGMIFDD